MATSYRARTAKYLVAAIFAGSMLACNPNAAAQEVAFAFTDTLAESSGLDATARTKLLVNSLKRVAVPQAMFLIRTADINAKTLGRLEYYNQTGQLLVNAGAHHSSLSRINQAAMLRDLAKANSILSEYSQYRQHVHLAYLYQGGDPGIVADLQHYLAEHYYQPSYTSYQARDDYLDQLYQAQLTEGSIENLKSLQQVYVNLVTDELTAYSAQALLLLGYYPRQVVLLHETDLTAYSLVSLVDALTAKGFKIIAPEKIFSDPIANPFFAAGYSATDYMPWLTGFAAPARKSPYLPSAAEKEKIHRYLSAQGLARLIAEPPR